jgi:hypothetical protein
MKRPVTPSWPCLPPMMSIAITLIVLAGRAPSLCCPTMATDRHELWAAATAGVLGVVLGAVVTAIATENSADKQAEATATAITNQVAGETERSRAEFLRGGARSSIPR